MYFRGHLNGVTGDGKGPSVRYTYGLVIAGALLTACSSTSAAPEVDISPTIRDLAEAMGEFESQTFSCNPEPHALICQGVIDASPVALFFSQQGDDSLQDFVDKQQAVYCSEERSALNDPTTSLERNQDRFFVVGPDWLAGTIAKESMADSIALATNGEVWTGEYFCDLILE